MTPPTGTPRMADAVSKAERLLRAVELMRVAADRVESPKMPEDTTRYDDADCDGFCLADDLRAAADALVLVPAWRGPTRQQVVDVLERYRRMAWDGAEKNAIIAVGQSVLALFTAAPPLPPATGEGFPPVCGTGTHWFKQSAPGTRCVCGATSIPAPVLLAPSPRPTPEPSEGEAECASCGNRNDQHRADGECPEYGYFVPAARPTPEPSEAMVEAVEKEKDALRTSSATYHSSIYVIRLTEAFAAIDRIAALAAQEGGK